MSTALFLMGIITAGAFIFQLVCYNNHLKGKNI